MIAKTKINFDEYGHFLFTKFTLARKEFFPTKINYHVINSQPYDYPLLWQATLGRFFYGSNIFIDRLKPLFFEILIVIFIASLLSNEVNPFKFVLIYLISPFSFTSFNTGPRLGFSPRLSIELISSLGFVFLYIGLNETKYIYLFFSLILFAFSCLSAKFANQAVFFTLIILGIILSSIEIFLFAVILFFICMISSKGRYFYQLKEQILHLKWWNSRNKTGSMHFQSRFIPNFGAFLNLKNFLNEFYDQFLFKNAITSVFIKNPTAFLVLIFIFTDLISKFVSFSDGFSVTSNIFIKSIFTSSCIIWLVVSTKKFLFFGESERYLNYIWPFQILILLNLNFFYDFEYLIIFYGFVYLIFELLFKVLSKDLNKNETGVFEFLNTLPISNVLFSHYHASGGVWRVLCETNHKILFSFVAGENERKKFENNYPSKNITQIENKYIPEIVKDYSIKYVITPISNSDVDNFLTNIIYQDDKFSVYEIC